MLLKTLAHATTRQQEREKFDEQNDNATTIQAQKRLIIYGMGYDGGGINNPPTLINHYNKYKKTYITIIIILLLLILAILLSTCNNVNTMYDSTGYQLTATPGMKAEM